MKVRELIDVLQTVDPDLDVIVQKDAEGNGYSPLAGAEAVYYVAANPWSGTIYGQEDMASGWAEEGGTTVVVLWPVN